MKSEDDLQRAVIAHIRARGVRGVLWWHTPNGGSRNRIEAAKLKGLGVLPGVADLSFVGPGGIYHGLELKNGFRSYPTAAQTAFASAINAIGGRASIVHDLDGALSVLERWGLLKGSVA